MRIIAAKNDSGSELCAVLQALCGVVLVALVSVGVLGLVFGASVGRSCSWCQSAACVETRWWTCQSTQQPLCSYAAFGNGTAHIDCSGVRTIAAPCRASEMSKSADCHRLISSLAPHQIMGTL